MKTDEKRSAPAGQAGAVSPESITCNGKDDTSLVFVKNETSSFLAGAANGPSRHIKRPGVSHEMLAAAGVCRVEPAEAFAAVGYREAGLLIPYRTLTGAAHEVNGRAFARLRLDTPRTGGAKYLSPAKSGCHAYFPPGLRELLLPGCVLGIVEGEFKALALVEAGFPCVGIGGISTACPKDATGEPALLPDIARLIAEVRPVALAFIGDADTALIPEFSREALKLAKLAGVPVRLPRIPFNAPGKGPDDLREAWGERFTARWQSILEDAEEVDVKVTSAWLALRLLRRETAALELLPAEQKEAAKVRLVKFAAGLRDAPLEQDDIERIAVDVFGLEKRRFREAVSQRAKDAEREATDKRNEAALKALAADGESPLFFDGVNYWRRESDGAFGRLCREDARLHLNEAGLSHYGDPSPCDAALHSLQKRNRVDYAGPLCGRPAGLHEENGVPVLATRGPEWIEGRPGDAPTITRIIANVFGAAVPDEEHAERQIALFCGWLKLARNAVRNFRTHNPGHVLALVGPAACGKTLLQSAIITPALGGRSVDPSLFLTGGTVFSADLWAAEHLAIGDKALDVEGRQRPTLRNELKRIVAESHFPLHAKGRDARTFRPVWRISLSANSDPESASNLPALDASFADKIIYLLCYAPPEPFFDEKVAGAREAFARKLQDELPAFLAVIDAYEIPPELRKERFGLIEWHHPEILGLLEDGDPIRPFEEVFQSWISGWDSQVEEKTLSTRSLFGELEKLADVSRLKITTGVSHLGHQLAKLSTKPGWEGRIQRADGRTGGRVENRKIAGWKITRG